MVMGPDGFEPDCQQVIRWKHARDAVSPTVAERLDGLDTPAGKVLGDALDQHPPQAAALELGQDTGGHQQYRVGADRAGGEGDRPRDVERRGVEDVAGWHAVDVGDLPAAAPFEQHRGNPRLLFQGRVTSLLRPGVAYRV